MPSIARQTDKAKCDTDTHGCNACPHSVRGPIVQGSPNVFVNGLPIARIDDPGLHAPCCDGNFFSISAGSSTVFANGKPVARKGDATKHCGGFGQITDGSENVNAG